VHDRDVGAGDLQPATEEAGPLRSTEKAFAGGPSHPRVPGGYKSGLNGGTIQAPAHGGLSPQIAKLREHPFRWDRFHDSKNKTKTIQNGKTQLRRSISAVPLKNGGQKNTTDRGAWGPVDFREVRGWSSVRGLQTQKDGRQTKGKRGKNEESQITVCGEGKTRRSIITMGTTGMTDLLGTVKSWSRPVCPFHRSANQGSSREGA